MSNKTKSSIVICYNFELSKCFKLCTLATSSELKAFPIDFDSLLKSFPENDYTASGSSSSSTCTSFSNI